MTGSVDVNPDGSCFANNATFPVLASTPLTEKKVGQTYQLTASKLTFTGANLPAAPGRYALFVGWTITEPATNAVINAGDEYHILYLTAAPYQPPTGREQAVSR